MLDLTLVALRVALGLALALALVNIVRNVRRSRKAPYFILRQAAATRFLRWLLVLAVSGIAFGLSFWVRLPPLTSLRPAPTSTLEATASLPATALPTDTPLPPVEAEEETPASVEATITPTPLPSLTPSPMFATRESDVTPQAEARVTITAISTDLGVDFLPSNPGTAFEAGATRFYVFFDFEGMSDGASWSVVVLVDGQLADDVSFDQLWSMGAEGAGLYRWFDRDEGWPSGDYEVQFYIGDQRADSATFQMVGDTS